MNLRYLPALLLALALPTPAAERPNILFIAVDDLNDWIGCLGGHPQVKTPNIDRLAKRGILFTNAHCQSPVCNPSRASLLSGISPETSGIYFLDPPLDTTETGENNEVLPRRFEREGFHVTGAGKIFHSRENQSHIPNYAGNFGGFGPVPKKKISPFEGHPLWDWGSFPERDDLMTDHKVASWATEQLTKKSEQPFLLMAGLVTPHVPQFTPQKWIDLYPLDTLQLPKIQKDDLSDISPYAVDLTRLKHVAPTHEWVVANKQWKPLVQTYLACVSFTDHQVGRLLDALDASPHKNNTIIVFFSDHGFHLGEKDRWAKRTIWQDGSGVPMIIAGPSVAKGRVCDKPVQLLDLYPTLLDLTGLKANPKHEGHSLKPLLEDPAADWPHTARSSFGPKNMAIVSETFRYIHYADRSEELYNRKSDPHEWSNLASDPAMKGILASHRAELPTKYHAILGKGSTGHQAFEAASQGLEK
ncbi:MAG: sulfatase [Akkermansiaceae bacterium]|jgi:arylsulfatase A-like enzyme